MMEKVFSQFAYEGNVIRWERYGSGHINETYRVVTDARRAYILQKLSSQAFQNVPALMENVMAVVNHLQAKASDPRRALTLIPTRNRQSFYLSPQGDYWRSWAFIEGGLCLDAPETPDDLYQSGAAFGEFQNQLADFPAETLHETLPRFHDTPDRYRLFREAIRFDKAGRLAHVKNEVNGYLAHEAEASYLTDLCRRGRLPLRVTHNDTKLNNVMLDAATRTPLCVIDLDTVMPGLAAFDFGDSIRFGASTAAEDEKDLSRVSLSLERFRAYAHGFLKACGKTLTHEEVASLLWGAKLMTLECGVRFLTDHLNGDVYFHVAYPSHNLDRCRTQLALVEDMENKWPRLESILTELEHTLCR